MPKTLTLTVSDRTSAVIDSLKESTGATSKAEVIRKAIALLNAAASAHKVTLEREDGRQETILIDL